MMTKEFSEGYDACSLGKGILDNPYLKKGDATGIPEACRWIDGWVQRIIDGKSMCTTECNNSCKSLCTECNNLRCPECDTPGYLIIPSFKDCQTCLKLRLEFIERFTDGTRKKVPDGTHEKDP